MTTLLLKIYAYGVCEGRLDDGVCRGEAALAEEVVAVIELFNQEEDHILVKVYLPVAIS